VQLADGGDDRDGVEECSGERPLQPGVFVVTEILPVPAIFHFRHHLALEPVEDVFHFPREILVGGRRVEILRRRGKTRLVVPLFDGLDLYLYEPVDLNLNK